MLIFHDRAVYRGAWKPSNANATFIRDFFANVQNAKLPLVDSLQPGTVTRFFYDKIPNRDTLGVVLYPNRLDASNAFKYSRGQLAATISDIEFNEQENNVVRISTTNSYDKYGRIVATYTYDPTMPADSLKMLAVINEYDLGGKLVKTAKYPFGTENGGAIRKIEERYTYDRLGRVDSILSKNGESSETMLAHYAYYPTGNVKSISMGNSLVLTYTYHISGAVKTANAQNRNGKKLFAEELYYEDCGEMQCIPQYNGNISRMLHELAFNKEGGLTMRDAIYVYDELNRLKNVDDLIQDNYDEQFLYDAQGRMTQQRRGAHFTAMRYGGEYSYYAESNRLEKILGAMSIDESLHRDMSTPQNFVYDFTGNLVEDKSKGLKISYDWRGMPVEFRMETRSGNVLENTRSCSRDSVRVLMAYDGSGRRVSKTRERKACLSETSTGATSERTYAADWERELVTHYTDIGTEVRESYSEGSFQDARVVANMPKGLGRYGIENASAQNVASDFEWYLKNHLGSTMLVYATGVSADGSIKAAYDYRAFGEQVDLAVPAEKVTENFTGKERDDETALNYFGARYLDPMIGLWISVDPKRQFSSPYLYVGNGMNPIGAIDPDGNVLIMDKVTAQNYMSWLNSSTQEINAERWKRFNTLNNSPRVYQSKLRKTGQDNLYIDPNAGPLNGEYSNEQNVGYVNGTMENFFHEILGHAYHDELQAIKSDGVGLEQGQTREQFIGFEKDAREIERGRKLTPKENEDVENVYGDVFDNTK